MAGPGLASAVKARLRHAAVEHEIADLAGLVEHRIVQCVGAHVAPVTVEAVMRGRRARAGQLEDAVGDVERDVGRVDLGLIGLDRGFAALACGNRAAARKR